MVNPYSRLAGFLQPVRGYATGDEVIRPPTAAEELEVETPLKEYAKHLKQTYIDVPEENIKEAGEYAGEYATRQVSGQIGGHLRKKYKPRFDWKAAFKWMKDFNNQKHPFQKPVKGAYPMKPTKFDRLMFSLFSPTKKATVVKNIALNAGYKIAPELVEATKNLFSQDEVETSDFQDFMEINEKVITPKPFDISTVHKANVPASTAELANRGFKKDNNGKIFPAEWLERGEKNRWNVKEKYN